jgi:hypothetical protein
VRIISEGIAYDTDKAAKIAGGNNGQWSEAWWGLYRTPAGAFFKIVFDHDGETLLECRTLPDSEARTCLEKHANGLVEKHFGPMPEPAPSQEVSISSDDWISASAAIALLEAMMGSRTAQMTLAARAYDGIVRSRAERFFRGRRVENDIELPKEFWWLAGMRHLIRIGQREISTRTSINGSIGEPTVFVFCAPKSRK